MLAKLVRMRDQLVFAAFILATVLVVALVVIYWAYENQIPLRWDAAKKAFASPTGWNEPSAHSKPGNSSQTFIDVPIWVWPVVLVFLAIVILAVVWLYWTAVQGKLKEAEQERKARESAADRLREKTELNSLIHYNQLLLDEYHLIATKQATKAYSSSRRAMNIGVLIFIVAFVASWRLTAQGDRLFVGTLATVGTAFTTYLSRTYMQTYERALQQLNQYFNQPVLNGYFLAAERIAAMLPDDRQDEAMERIVGDILESGKEMHRGILNANTARTTLSNPPRSRRVPGEVSSVPAQQAE
ncbi:hypothetical protein ACWEQN_38690 [Streptomyces sp. NPDC004129]|uniref:hypothetical protein n=1 Tax=Streptomyces sp. NPDC004533 TaxID=3154278 RepID=UPI0033A8E444